MKVLYFGSYNPDYPRSRIIVKGLEKNGVEVAECRDTFPNLPLRYLKLLKKYGRDHDAIIVGFTDWTNVPLARILGKLGGKPLIFDCLSSLYDTLIFDRKVVSEHSLKSTYYFCLEKLAYRMSNVVIVGTYEYAKYLHEIFKIPRKKLKSVPLGADDEIFYPRKVKRKNKTFNVVYHGTFIPIHGIEHIIKAAKILESHKDIKFTFIGRGPMFDDAVNLSKKLNLKNISFKGRIEREEMLKHIANANVGLGLFGDTAKARRCIGNKPYEILAMGLPLITGDSPATREIFTHKQDCILCEMANPNALANAILLLKNDRKLRKMIAKNGYALFKKNFSAEAIGRKIKEILDELLRA